MSQRPTEESAAHVEKRLNKFLDCVARLLAKRSLGEQQQDDEQESPEQKRGEDEQ